MRKRNAAIITALALLLFAMPHISVNAAGNITISNLTELEAFRDDVNSGNTYEGKTVTLIADIDMSEKYGEGKESWIAIGNADITAYPVSGGIFAGTFYGLRHKISGLYINDDGCGLFGYCKGTISSIDVEGEINDYKSMFAGGIVGLLDSGGKVEDCSFSGSIEDERHIGGIAGASSGIVSDCFNTGSVKALHCGGGIVGTNDGGSIMNCFNAGKIEKKTGDEGYESEFFGGITSGGTVNNCYYLVGTAENGAYESTGSATALTQAQFASGEAAYLLNNGKTDFDTFWRQNIGSDIFPVLDNAHGRVFYNGKEYYNPDFIIEDEIYKHMGKYEVYYTQNTEDIVYITVAEYTENGELLSVTSNKLSAMNRPMHTYGEYFGSITGNAKYVKVFAWRDSLSGMLPMCEPKTFQYEDIPISDAD